MKANKFYSAAFALLLLGNTAYCQTFTEIALTPNWPSFPWIQGVFHNKLVMAALDTSSTDVETWLSDGTQTGTGMLKDIYSTNYNRIIPHCYKSYYSSMAFIDNDSVNGRTLWITDMTTPSTKKITDHLPDTISNVRSSDMIIPYSGKLYFFRTAPSGSAVHPWMTDGTPGGTMILKSVDMFRSGSFLEAEPLLHVCNSNLFFTANDTVHGSELWISDGSPTGTKMLKDIVTGSKSSYPSAYREYNGKAFFAAIDSVNIKSAWVSDGTTGGTHILKPGLYFRDWVGVLNGKLLFWGNDGVYGYELWQTDGTAAGTTMVKDISPGTLSSYWGSNNYDVKEYIIENNRLYFGVDDRSHGFELWMTDGTTSGTQMVADINAGSASSYPTGFISLGGKIYFSAVDSLHGNELWVTDGTTTGTQLVKDIYPGSQSGGPYYFKVYHGKLYFVAKNDANGIKMFQSDGTDGGTITLAPPGVTNFYPLSTFRGFTEYNNKLYLAANFSPNGTQLWSFQDTTILSVPKPEQSFQTIIYPNPAHTNDVVTMQYYLTEQANVNVKLVNVYGQVLVTLYSGNETEGEHRVKFRVSDYNLPAGIYLIQVSSPAGTSIQKINMY